MKILLMLISSCQFASAQTNALPAPALPYSTPAFQIRPLSLEPSKAPGVSINPGVTTNSFPTRQPESGLREKLWTNTVPNVPFEAASPSARILDFDRQVFERLDREGYFTRPEPPSDNRLVQFANSTFEPEVFQFRHVSVSSSLITAIQHRNPLCLVTQLFLNIEW